MKRSGLLVIFLTGLLASSVLAGDGPGAQASSEVNFAPPKTRKAVRFAFWETIFRLERKHAAYGYRNGRKELVDGIKENLARLSPPQRTDIMLRFLRVSYYYKGKEDEGKDPALREIYGEHFLKEVRAYSRKAQREYLKNKDDTYLRLFANIRSLAAAGPEGLKLSRDLAGIDPTNSTIQGNLAQDYLNVGYLESAIEASERAIRLDPTNASPFTTMASAKYSLGDQEGAHAAASSALLIDPGDKVAYSIVKLTKSRVASGEEAEDETTGEIPVLVMNFGAMEAPEKDAVVSLAAQVGRSPAARIRIPTATIALRESNRLSNQARMEIRKGDYSKAVRLTTFAIEKNPANTAALFRRAHANYRLKNFQDALADTTVALRLMGEAPSPILRMLHARVLNSLDRFDEALEVADSALEGKTAAAIKAKLLFQKAWSLGGLGRKEDALHVLAQAARLDEKYIPYYQEALELPAEAEWSVFFSAEFLAEAAPYKRHGEGETSKSKGERMAMILGMTLLGGFLVALGLLRAVAGKRNTAAESAVAAGVGIAPPHSDLIGGAFKIRRKIGAGGMGIVYEAFDVHLERAVAIKKMREEIGYDPRERERFLSEARTVAALRHPNIVEIFSVVADASDIFLVFELVDGHTVRDYIHHYKKLDFGPALRILHGTAAGLEYAHERGVIHRDLKPSNIMIDRAGRVKVMDFGVARRVKDSCQALSQSMTVSGTPPYMAPEAEQGMTCRSSDVFAMAVCFYELVTGELPFEGTNAGMALSKINKSFIPASQRVSGLPEGFDAVMAWGLEPDPAKRCQTPRKFASALEGLRVGLKA